MKAKKVFSVLLAAALLSLAVLCVQAEEPGYPRDQVPSEARTAGIWMDYLAGEPNVKHTYLVYQLAKGEVFMEGEKPVLGAVERGSSLQEDDDFQSMLEGTLALMDPESPYYCTSEIDLIKQLNSLWYIDAKRIPYAEMTNEQLLDVEPGYYLIVDTNKNLPETQQSFSAYIFGEALGKTPETGLLTVEPKATTTSLKKEVRDNSKENNWGDHADFSLSNTDGQQITPYLDGLEELVKLEDVLNPNDLHRDVVAFRLTATLGENLDLYDSYKLIFYDVPPVEVDYLKIDNEDGECLYRVEIVDKEENPKFETFNCLNDGKLKGFCFEKPEKNERNIQFGIDDVKQAFIGEDGEPVKLEPGDQVRVTYYMYTQKTEFPMGDDETLSHEGMTVATNKAELEYSNDPMSDQMGKTEPEEAKLYTYSVMIIKTNKGGDPLTGATFALKKKDDSPGAEPNTWIDMSGRTDDDINDRTYGQLELGKEPYADSSDPAATNMWLWKQIDAGDYELVETQAPDGYDKLEEPIQFKLESGLKDGKWTAVISTPPLEENDAVMACGKETVYTFEYYPNMYEEEGYLVYLPASSPIYQNVPGADHRYFPRDLPEDLLEELSEDFLEELPEDLRKFYLEGHNLNLQDLVAYAKEGIFLGCAFDDKGGVWYVADPDRHWMGDFECEALTITVRNFRPDEKDEGVMLPVSGGVGTTAFYVVGGMMVLFAGVILITRKRMSREW